MITFLLIFIINTIKSNNNEREMDRIDKEMFICLLAICLSFQQHRRSCASSRGAAPWLKSVANDSGRLPCRLGWGNGGMRKEKRRRPRRAASRRQKSWVMQVDSEGEAFSSGSGTGGRSGPPPARQGDTQGGLPD